LKSSGRFAPRAYAEMLEDRGELDRTIVICTSDTAWPFARQVHALRLRRQNALGRSMAREGRGRRTVDDFVSLTDIAPTVLEAAGLSPPAAMTGSSLLGILTGKRQRHDAKRTRVYTALERHAWSRQGELLSVRALRTADSCTSETTNPTAGRPAIPIM